MSAGPASRVGRTGVRKLHHAPVTRWDWERTIRRAELKPTTKLIALMVATWANADGSRVRPGDALIAKTTGYEKRCVREHMALLVQLGLLEVVAGATREDGAIYQLTLPAADHPIVPMRLDPDNDLYEERPPGRLGMRRPKKSGTPVPLDGDGPPHNSGTPVPLNSEMSGTPVPVDNGNERHPGAAEPDDERHPGAASAAPGRTLSGTGASFERHPGATHQYRPVSPDQRPPVVALAGYGTYAATTDPPPQPPADPAEDDAATERRAFAEAARAEERRAFAAAAGALGAAPTVERDRALSAARDGLIAEGISPTLNMRALTIRAGALLAQHTSEDP